MRQMEMIIAAAEAPKLLYRNPSWSYEKVINKVKEMMIHGPETKDKPN